MWRNVLFILFSMVTLLEGGRCRNRQNRIEDIHRPRLCRGEDSFISNDYWAAIYKGDFRNPARSRSDLLILDQDSDGYIAYWFGITNSNYGNIFYETFGQASYEDDGSLCATFIGLHGEIVKTCGGFRVLSRNLQNPDEPVPFEWVNADDLKDGTTLGFRAHRIAKYVGEEETIIGDVYLKNTSFHGFSELEDSAVDASSDDPNIWFLRRKVHLHHHRHHHHHRHRRHHHQG